MLTDLYPYFAALADKKRLQILQYLGGQERVTVTQLGDELHLSQPLMSWHLRKLRRAGLVQTSREGRQVWCSLNRHNLQLCHEMLIESLGITEATNEQQSDPIRLELQAARHG